MACSDVANCIESDGATRAAISGLASQASQPGTTATPGQPLSDTAWSGNLTPTDDCSLNAFWAQCEQFVNWIVTAGIDTLEALEQWSNAVEAAQFIEMAPFIGTLVDEAQIDQVLEFVDWCLSVAQEAFLAADTQPNRQAIACALFCDMRHDCALSLEGAWDVINGRLGGVLTPSSIDSVEELLEAAVTLVNNPAVPLDTWLIIVLSLGKVMSYLGVQGINQSLNIVLKLAVNDANNDWETLCMDCPPPTEDRTPVIASNWDPTHLGGTISGPDETGLWTATTTFRPTTGDQAITMMDTLGRSFVLEDVTYSSPPQCQVFLLGGVLLNLTCDSFNHYVGQTIDEFTVTWPDAGGTQTMTFRMVAPA